MQQKPKETFTDPQLGESIDYSLLSLFEDLALESGKDPFKLVSHFFVDLQRAYSQFGGKGTFVQVDNVSWPPLFKWDSKDAIEQDLLNILQKQLPSETTLIKAGLRKAFPSKDLAALSDNSKKVRKETVRKGKNDPKDLQPKQAPGILSLSVRAPLNNLLCKEGRKGVPVNRVSEYVQSEKFFKGISDEQIVILWKAAWKEKDFQETLGRILSDCPKLLKNSPTQEQAEDLMKTLSHLLVALSE